MSKSIGMAINITKDNRHSIAIVNGGVVPREEDIPLYQGSYFIFPYDPDVFPSILPAYAFFESFAFANTESPTHFVDIVEI